jgi:hypothetical protein
MGNAVVFQCIEILEPDRIGIERGEYVTCRNPWSTTDLLNADFVNADTARVSADTILRAMANSGADSETPSIIGFAISGSHNAAESANSTRSCARYRNSVPVSPAATR